MSRFVLLDEMGGSFRQAADLTVRSLDRPVLKHLPGKHDQKDHGRRGAGLSPDVASSILDRVKANGGLSVSMLDGHEPVKGFMVAKGGTKGAIVPADEFFDPVKGPEHLASFLKTYRRDLGGGGSYLGLWHNTEDGNVYLDVSDNIMDEAKAVTAGRRRNQISIWDVANFREVNTGGTGELAKAASGDAVAGHLEDERRGDRRVGEDDLGAVRREGEVVRFAPGLIPVLKHPGHSPQKVHGGEGEGQQKPVRGPKPRKRPQPKTVAAPLDSDTVPRSVRSAFETLSDPEVFNRFVDEHEHGGGCEDIATAVEDRFGLRAVQGTWRGPSGRREYHAWNEGEDGTILDAAQYVFRDGDGDGPHAYPASAGQYSVRGYLEKGLEPVQKHPGHANQKVHGRRGSGGSLPGRWEKVSDDDLKKALVDRMVASGEADRTTAEYIAAKRVETFDTYGDGATTLIVAKASRLKPQDLVETMEMADRLQASDPRPGMEIEISDSAFRDHGLDDSGYGGFAYVGRPNVYLRPSTVRKGLRPEALMPSVVGNEGVYGLVHEWGHTVDSRDGTQAAIDHNTVLGIAGMGGLVGAARAARPMRSADVFADLERPKPLSTYGATNKRESFAEAFAEFHLNPGSATSNPVVSYFVEAYNWGSGGESVSKATGPVEICADTFTADGVAVRTMMPPTLVDRFGPKPEVVKFAPGLRPVLKHGSPGDKGYAAMHPNGRAGRAAKPESAVDESTGYAGLNPATARAVTDAADAKGVPIRAVEQEFERRLDVAKTMDDPYQPGHTAESGGMVWYEEAGRFADDVGGGDRAKGAGIVAALSGQNPWPSNQTAAELVKHMSDHRDELGLTDDPKTAWAHYQSVQKDFGAQTGARTGRKGGTGPVGEREFTQAWRIANGEPVDKVLTGRKRRNFYNNILGDTESVTVDVHMMKALSTTPGSQIVGKKAAAAFWQQSWDKTKSSAKSGAEPIVVSGVGYSVAAQAVINVARRRGLEPRQVQAIIWNTCVTEKWVRPPSDTGSGEETTQ